MKPKWQKLASLAQKICTLWFQFYGAFFASKGYPFKNIFYCFKILNYGPSIYTISVGYNCPRRQTKILRAYIPAYK